MTYVYKEHGTKIVEYNSRNKDSLANFIKMLIAKGVISTKEIKQIYIDTQEEYTDEIAKEIDVCAEKVIKVIK